MTGFLRWSALVLFLGGVLACGLPLGPVSTPAAPPSTRTLSAPVATLTPAATPTLPAAPTTTLAFIRENAVWLADLPNGAERVLQPAGVGETLTGLTWSPRGDVLAVETWRDEQSVILLVPADGGPVRVLGAGAQPVWSPDAQSMLVLRGGYNPEANWWLVNVATSEARQLTSNINWAWGNAVFTPDGANIIIAGADWDLMGASGNTEFTLEQLNLQTGQRQPLGAPEFGRLPFNLSLSPDGRYVAYTTSVHVNACASGGTLVISEANGVNRRQVISPAFADLVRATASPSEEYYHMAWSYAWLADSQQVFVASEVRNCADFAGTLVGGPVLSQLTLAGAEPWGLPGTFNQLTTSADGRYLAAQAYTDVNIGAFSLQVYDLTTRQAVWDGGAGTAAAFAP